MYTYTACVAKVIAFLDSLLIKNIFSSSVAHATLYNIAALSCE